MRVFNGLVVAILCMGLGCSVSSLGGLLINSAEGVIVDQSFNNQRNFALEDGVPGSEEYYGFTPSPEHNLLEVHSSDDTNFESMAVSPYYRVYFKGTVVRIVIRNAWIEVKLINQELGDIQSTDHVTSENIITVPDVFASANLSYEATISQVKETLILEEMKSFERVIHEISWNGVIPVFQDDGSILFSDAEGEEIAEVLPPFMKDAQDSVCADVHYELIKTESSYELHKVIGEKGLEWLKEAVYPVVIDPTVQTLEDAWKSSGLTPYGQYFRNLKEYVNPANGHLTVTQTDLTIPGRCMDLVISRIYEMPAVFYGENPAGADYEAPPVDVGKGWQLDFPWVGSKYVHLWGGTVYKITWVNNTFENHVGSHFKLVKNGDNTYTLATASGRVYEFNTSGKVTHIKDIDQNTITFNYTSGVLTSITDTIGRTTSLSYVNNRLWKIIYNGTEIEFSYDSNGCLQWMEDFLNRRTSYSYNTGYNNWLLSRITYPTTGYATYAYNRFTNDNYYKYYVTNQRVYETNQVRHTTFSYAGSFSEITACTITVKNESDITEGSYDFTMSDGLISQQVIKNALGMVICKYEYTFNSRNEVSEEKVYNDGSNLSYVTTYYYDNWGNTIYCRDAEGHEQFFSYANTDTSGFFVDNTGTIIKKFTNAFTNTPVPSSVHTVLLGTAEKQDTTYMRETYLAYDFEAHPTQMKNTFGNSTEWLTFSGTFNEKTGNTSFPLDLTGYAVAGNGVLQVTGLPSDDTYQENHSTTCDCFPRSCAWLPSGSGWSRNYYTVHWYWTWGVPPDFEWDEGYTSIGPFTHYPGSLGYLNYSTNPPLGQSSNTFTVTTNWKAFPVAVQYKLDTDSWTTVSSNVRNTTAQITVPLTDGFHTLYFSESSIQNTKFSWNLYVPVDNSPSTFTTSLQYDTYGNITSITDAESNSVSLAYSGTYQHAYVTEISATVGDDTITTRAAYDYSRGWITSLQEPKGVHAGSGYDYLYTYDVLGRITKKEFPLLPGQYQRSYLEAVYDDSNRTVAIIDQLRHYFTQEYDKLGRLTSVKKYTGTYGSGTLYATESCTYRYDNQISAMTDAGNHQTTYVYDFLGRITEIIYPGSVSVSFSYDDTNNKTTLTNGRSYDTIYWYDWLSRLVKVEEEYTPNTFATTTYEHDEVGHLTSFTDAEAHTTSFTYASIFGLTRITYPDFEYEEYEYDNVGNIIAVIDCKGYDTVFTYDDLYRLTQIQYPDQTPLSFTYDLNSNRISMVDNAPSANDYGEYSHDCWNRLLSETRHISTSTYTISYQYDAASRLTGLTYPDNMQIQYSYDDLDRMTEIKRFIDGSNDEILMDNVQYNSESLLMQFDYGNDLQAIFSYDSRDRLSTLDVKNGEISFLDLDFTHDNNSNIIQLVNGWRDTDSTWHSETESYYYDGLDRLTSASCTSWSHTYSYDRAGNRVSKDSVTYTINAVNEVTALSDGTSYTYDDNGNRTQMTKGTDTWIYTYDSANKLTKVEKNSTTVGEYTYDGDARRVQATEEGLTKTYINSGIYTLYEENTTGTATYIYGPIGILAKRTTIESESNTFYYHTDHLGSTRLVTEGSRSIVTDVVYEPFGESTVTGSESRLYTGKDIDSTGLYYYGARYYDSDLGRFVTRDPFGGKSGTPQSLNQYAYCLNNPVNRIDPAGMVSYHNVTTGIILRKTADGWVLYREDGVKITREELDAIDEEIEEAKKIKDKNEREKAFKEALHHLLELFGVDHLWDPDYGLTGRLEIQGFIVVIDDKLYATEGKVGKVPIDYDFESGTFVSKFIIKLDPKAFDYGAAGLFIIIAHELKHVEQHLENVYYYTQNPDIAETQANQVADYWYETLLYLYDWWNVGTRIRMWLAKQNAL